MASESALRFAGTLQLRYEPRHRRPGLTEGLKALDHLVGSASSFAPSAIKASSSFPIYNSISEYTPASGDTSVRAVRRALSSSHTYSNTLEYTLAFSGRRWHSSWGVHPEICRDPSVAGSSPAIGALACRRA
ncbi:hypothetical protein PoB_003649900 [Plakobranchus ocellatus]|uniref:Uncharacterized protein n=1 Tax=Plakobranchus ocellatus TaxID=259542 RepID=A0AAV4AQC5_9GAST|nr:hypothetical protein PoB_003649900 [Plakobranchus ocellatus]